MNSHQQYRTTFLNYTNKSWKISLSAREENKTERKAQQPNGAPELENDKDFPAPQNFFWDSFYKKKKKIIVSINFLIHDFSIILTIQFWNFFYDTYIFRDCLYKYLIS